MPNQLNDVVVVDAVRTPFGRAGEKGIFWNTRAEDLCVPLVKALIERNPALKPAMIEDSIWGVTNQVKEQGGTIGRMIPILAEWGWEIPGCSIDRMCASGLTAVGFAVSHIAGGMADCLIAGGVEHMGHLPMGFMRDPHPRAEELLGGPSAFNMGIAPVPATQKVLEKAGLTMDDMDLIEINEAFEVQALYFLDHFGLNADDPRVNCWGGAIAYGHPLAASGPRLVAFLCGLFRENPQARYGLTTMCVGRGQGYSVIWENCN